MARGAAAGAAGTTALNAATYIDMVMRARASSRTPQQLVEAVVGGVGLQVPGNEEQRENRLGGLGPLAGILTGVLVGAGAGAIHATGRKLPAALGAPLIGLIAMAAADLPLLLTGLSDPRKWATADWLADALPHLGYGVVTHAALASMERAGLS